jgi:LmbE family N-acetylglucosaminyl deacetylase
MAAARRYIKNIYCWESVFSYAEGLFIPNLYIDISQTLDTKTDSMAIHQTEYEKFGGFKILDQITTLAKYRGSQCGCDYAEAFLTLKEVR